MPSGTAYYGEGVSGDAASPDADPKPRPGRKRFLTRAAVVRAGLAVVETDGLEAVTIRRVATELGAAPMALYRHVKDKQELLLAMLDEMAQGIPAPRADGEPFDRLVYALLSLHDYLAEHPWLFDVLRQADMFSPRAVEQVDNALSILTELGLDEERALEAYSVLWWYVVGHLASLAGASPERRTARRRLAELAPLDRLPHAASAFRSWESFDHVSAFEVGLRAFVAGLLAR
jgi:AcrR family transcriptional regulator